jgi:hypothetical protein
MASFHHVFHSNLSYSFFSLPCMPYSPHILPTVIDHLHIWQAIQIIRLPIMHPSTTYYHLFCLQFRHSYEPSVFKHPMSTNSRKYSPVSIHI